MREGSDKVDVSNQFDLSHLSNCNGVSTQQTTNKKDRQERGGIEPNIWTKSNCKAKQKLDQQTIRACLSTSKTL